MVNLCQIFISCSESVSFPSRGQSGVKERGALGFPLKKDDTVNSISDKFSQQVFIDIYYLEHEVKVIKITFSVGNQLPEQKTLIKTHSNSFLRYVQQHIIPNK